MIFFSLKWRIIAQLELSTKFLHLDKVIWTSAVENFNFIHVLQVNNFSCSSCSILATNCSRKGSGDELAF